MLNNLIDAFHSEVHFSGYDLQVFVSAFVILCIWCIVFALVILTRSFTLHRSDALQNGNHIIEDLFFITTWSFVNIFASAVANTLGHGNTRGIAYSHWIAMALVSSWVILVLFTRRLFRFLVDCFFIFWLTIVFLMLWSRAIHSANGVQTDYGPVRHHSSATGMGTE
jgi:hypothetical protein